MPKLETLGFMNSVPAAAVWLKLPQCILRYIKNSAYIEGAYKKSR